VQSQYIIPTPEAEEFMTRRREKQRQQQSDRRPRTLSLLIERRVLIEGDELLFNRQMFEEEWWENGGEERWDPEYDFWWVVVTGKEGRSNNVRWLFDGEEYSIHGITLAIKKELGADEPYTSDGYWFWIHPEFDGQNLSHLQEEGVMALDRKDGQAI